MCLPRGSGLDRLAGRGASVALLVAVLACAAIRPWGWPEAIAAVPAAVVAIATGAISLDDARDEIEQLAPVVGFLAAVLVLAHLCAEEGLFRALGSWLAQAAAARPRRLSRTCSSSPP